MKALRRPLTCASPCPTPPSPWGLLRSLFVVTTTPSADRSRLKSPWSRRKRKHSLSQEQWNSFFTSDGKLHGKGVKFLKKVRSGGLDPSIRAEVWPFLLGVYGMNSSEAERKAVKAQKSKEYKKLRRSCRNFLKPTKSPRFDESPRYDDSRESPCYDDMSIWHFISGDHASPDANMEEEDQSVVTHVDASSGETDSSDGESSIEDEPESGRISFSVERTVELESEYTIQRAFSNHNRTPEDFASWQRIIHLDAKRANADWVAYSPSQASVSEDKACRSAEAVGLKDYALLEPWRIYHAARLVAVLEAYALYDPEIGYCQGMSDLLSPILAVMEDNSESFWCFVGFMRKARHNFRLDEVGISRQLSIVSKIIKCKDTHLYRHLQNLQAEDCFFVYRMVVVLFRRELTFDQTLCLWEVMWADQAAIRAGIGKSAWGITRLRAPPTDDLLLYAIAACVLQRRKFIIQRNTSMDEIMRECNSMAGHLDLWKLLDDAHDLVVTLHDKI